MFSSHQVKKYFWSLLGIFGIVMFWAGIWDGIGNLPYLVNPLISLAVGSIILIISAILFKELEMFGGKTDPQVVIMHKIKAHPEKEKIIIKYYDKLINKNISINAKNIHKIEKDAFLVVNQNKNEIFIPIHRIKEVLYKGKPWKTKK